MIRPSTIRIAWRSLGRNRRRTALAVGAVALGQFTLIFIEGLIGGSFEQMLNSVTGPLVGHVRLHHPGWVAERAVELNMPDRVRRCAQVRDVPGVQNVCPRMYSAVLAASGAKSDSPATAEPGMVVGLDLQAEAGTGGILEHVDPARFAEPGTVLVGTVLARRIGVAAGDQVALIGQDVDGFPATDLFPVGGVVDSSVDVVKLSGVVMSLAAAGEFLGLPDHAHEIVVRGERHELADSLADRIRASPAAAGDSIEVQTWQKAVPRFVHFMEMKDVMDLIFLTIVFVAAAAGIANTAMMSTFERTHEFGMLLAIGSRPSRIVSMVVVESVITGVLGVMLGSVLGCLLVWITGKTGVDYSALSGGEITDFSWNGVHISYLVYPKLSLRPVVFGFAAVTLTSIVAALWPAMLAARMEPVEAMRT